MVSYTYFEFKVQLFKAHTPTQAPTHAYLIVNNYELQNSEKYFFYMHNVRRLINV